MKRRLVSLCLVCALAVVTAPVGAESTRIQILSRQPVLGGRAFGLAGGYEHVRAVAHFAVDPDSPANRAIVDLDLAPRDADGRVAFSADLEILRPLEPARGNGTLLVPISNRGRLGILSSLAGGGPPDPDDPEAFGDGFLLNQGFTVAWVGWQFDVPSPGLRLVAPTARAGDAPLTGQVIHRFQPAEPQPAEALPSPYAAFEPDGPGHTLRAGDPYSGALADVPRERWRFARVENGVPVADPTSVHLEGGFQPGQQYVLTYTTSDPPLSGLGFASVRDLVALAKYGDSPLLHAERAIAFGGSQSGRFLRDLLRDGFNADERGRPVFDGLIPVIAGAGGGFFNYRFAQPGLVSSAPPANQPVPADRFPFADLPQEDPYTGVTAGLLDRARASGTVPRVFYLNASSEYDDRGGALVHVLANGRGDAPLPDTTRVYTVLGAPHGARAGPAVSEGQLAFSNPNSWRWLARALIVAMQRWIADGTEPPASRYPRLADGTLVAYRDLAFPAIPGLPRPARAYEVQALDFGPGSERGIVRHPPRVLGAYPLLVPAVDDDGNERGGVKMPEVAVPLATYTGWNVVETSTGPALAVLSGSYIPFPRDRAAREASGDPRRSVEERYASKAEYLGRYAEAVRALVRDGLILPGDFAALMDIAEQRWAFHETDPPVRPRPSSGGGVAR